ncbi:MAG: hypothetical protein JW744_01845 [Candidatus Diapherotrites archaeon]|uniref:Carboxypeptidase regulatory-like domain-containing protein n=1 Tax=Candidatus Iainarchaeum sp. TaxID=3101447 RepID=A0A939C691_9ARCH|nr:hypothetical protein [Candidatus Diapherotrites archaeon]
MALEKLKETYFRLEDKWYAAIDKIDSKIPIAGLVDKVDRIVPSFALFAAIVVILIIYGLFFFPGLGPQGAAFSFKVIDTDGAALEGATVTVSINGQQVFAQQTNQSGETGQVMLPFEASAKIEVSKQGFVSYSQTITISQPTVPYHITLESEEDRAYTISLKDSLGQPVREAVTITLSCRNSSIAPWQVNVASGTTTVTEPANCNGLIASVRSSSFEPLDSIEISQRSQSIYLQEAISGSATITVELLFNNELVSDQATVYLYREDSSTGTAVGPIESTVSENGKAVFTRQAGRYIVKSSGYGSYAAVESASFSVSPNEQKTIQLHLERNVVGYIKLRILDERTSAPVDDADVFLRLGSEEIDSKASSADQNGLVEFPVAQDATYSVVVDHEAYCLKTVHDVTISSTVKQIKLSPFTSDCGGNLKVKVLDQDGRLVRNATVGLYTESGFNAGFGTRVTDANGIATFKGAPSNDYKAFAFKGASSGWSEVEHFVQRSAEKTLITVVLTVENGNVRVRVIDKEGMPVQFAQVAFIDTGTNQVIGGGAKPVEDANGVVELETRADKKVYIVASKPGYANFTSVPKEVISLGTQNFTATLEKEILEGKPLIEFRGIYKNGKSAVTLAHGETYTALFNLRIPANRTYSRIGMHVRSGSQGIMELDEAVLRGINVPGIANVLKSTSYTPDEGYETDSQNESSDEAKWANIEWIGIGTGIVEAEVELKVKESFNETSISSGELEMFYRSWAIEDMAYKRDPYDSDLGEAESVAGKQGLYAKAKQEIFQMGAEKICDEKFCFSASMLDVEAGLIESANDSYNGDVFKEYKLSFTVLNNSEYETHSYYNAELRILNQDKGILLQNYKVYGAQSQLVEGNAAGNETAWISIGDMLPNNTASGTIVLTPQNSGGSVLTIQIRSMQRVQFEKSIAINAAAEKQLNVVVAPELLPSGTENELTVTARDMRTNAELENATVKIKDRFGTVIASKSTNRMGIAVLSLPSMQPAETVQLIVGKPSYETFERMLQVDEKVIVAKPATIGVSLNAKTAFEAENSFSIENKTAFSLKVRGMKLNGRFYGLIDEEKANNWLYGYVEETISADELKEMRLKTFLTEKGKKLEQSRNLEGQLDITVSNNGSEWLQTVPVKISIGLGGEVDDPSCFTVTRKDWKGTSEGNPIEIEFEVQNNCSMNGIPVKLENIAAKASWQTNQVGEFALRTADSAITLTSGYSKKFAGTLEPEQSMSIVLQFTPNGGVNGKGIATIVFEAENPTDTIRQELTDELTAEITVANLAECMAVSKEILIIKPENSDSFDVETVNCGSRNEVKLESELTLSSSTLTLNATDSKGVEVFSEKNMPGQYLIRVYAKNSDQVQYRLVKTVRARILSDKCLDLSRYEFDVFDNPENPYDGYDTAELTNNCYDKAVTATVKYDEHNWLDAMKTGLLYGLATGAMGQLGSGMQQPAPQAAGNIAAAGNAVTFEQFQQGRTVADAGGRKGVPVEIGGRTYFKPIDSENLVYDAQGNAYRVEKTGGILGFGATEKATIVSGSSYPTARTEQEEIVLGSAAGLALLGGGGSGLTGMLGNGLISGLGQSILGKPSFLGWGLQGFLAGTIIAYNQQDEGSFSFTKIERDVVYRDAELYMPGASIEDNALVETKSEDIVVFEPAKPEVSTEPKQEDRQLSIETRKLWFLNKESVVQPDPATPLFRILKVDNERREYKTEYDLDEKETPDLEVKERKDHKESFRLQFNAFDPLLIERISKPIPNCTLGNIVGTTGPSAVPKVSFSWDWGSISEDSCVEGNPDYIYCDATQFSIVALKKLHRLQEFIDKYKPFDCPSPASEAAAKEQPIKGTAYDIAITKIQANKAGQSDANIVMTIESNNSEPIPVSISVNLRNAGTGSLAKSCTKEMSVLSRKVANCEFTQLGDGLYTVQASITSELCSNCENSDTGNDSIEVQLYVGTGGVVECEPFNTKRLPLFIEATEAAGNAAWSNSEREQILDTIKFNAYLIKDAYTNDFREDFDMFCKQRSFFDCPDYYLEESTGLHKLFSDRESFKFDYSMAPHAPLDAGKYSVTLNIEFDNQDWQLFSGTEPDATVSVELVELAAPEPDSPFYYLPFDGLVGIDSENGRQGYGINFRQTSEQTIKINNSIFQPIATTNIANSTPVLDGWIDAGSSDSFRRLNLERKGILLDVQKQGAATNIMLSPSYATPVMMQVDYEKTEHAYAFYSIEVDNTPQTAFNRMLAWSGIGPNCVDFTGSPVTEAWQDTWDMHGGITGNLSCAVATDITDYGIEWCNPIRQGSVFLQTVVFTPQGKSSTMKKTTYSDDMSLITADSSGSQVALNGVPGMEYNSFGTSTIDSIEDVFELVRENKVCIIGADSRISNQFFWNPKAVLEELSQQRSLAEKECIKAS